MSSTRVARPSATITVNTMPWIRKWSFSWIAWNSSAPMPGKPKITSTSTAPDRIWPERQRQRRGLRQDRVAHAVAQEDGAGAQPLASAKTT